ncbi:MAG: DNA methyltransferase [Microbacteriaceae bacterium]|nr:DNA methyltransferase [Microbacteriaceae bacterium]NBS61275.1 DNA methyltransferase [Microbacteriaceae bacterium]
MPKVNTSLGSAKRAKYDEFYTQYSDIENEMNAYLEFDSKVFANKTILLPCDDPEWSNFTKYFAQNFEKLGLKKLISTSYAPKSKDLDDLFAPSLFETESSIFDPKKSETNGRIFTLTRDVNKDKRIDFKDLEWDYLEGDGDFRSSELLALRDEADVVITNPPFSLFREFMSWLLEGNCDLVILGNMNAVTYKEIFPLIKENKIWLGATRNGVGSMWFEVLDSAPDKTGQKIINGKKYQTVGSSAWFASLDHGLRHQPLALMTESDNRKFSKIEGLRESGYQKYDNYDAIEVPQVQAIPSDYEGVMGVPITFLSKYNPDQFEIIGMSANGLVDQKYKLVHHKTHNEPWLNGHPKYQRIFIRHRKPAK